MKPKQILFTLILSLFLIPFFSFSLQQWARSITRHLRRKIVVKKTKPITSKKRYFTTKLPEKTTQFIVKTVQKPYSLYHGIKNILFSYSQRIKQFFYPEKKALTFITPPISIDYTIPTFTVNLLLPQDHRIEDIRTQLNQYEKSFSGIAHIIFVTPKQKTMIYEMKSLDTTNNLRTKKEILAQVRAIVSDQQQLASVLKKRKVNPEIAETITFIIDLNKTQEKEVEKIDRILKKYKNNTTWQRINILFLRDNKITPFQITRDQNTDTLKKATENLSKLLNKQYQPLIDAIKKIQEEPFSDLERLSIQKALLESFSKK